MRKLILAILLFASPVFAADQTVTFQWTANTDNVTGYNIYIGDTAESQTQVLNSELLTGITYTHVFTDEIEALKYFHIKATDGRNWSPPSNVINLMVDTKAPAATQTLTLTSD